MRLRRISFDGKQMRTDIAARAVERGHDGSMPERTEDRMSEQPRAPDTETRCPRSRRRSRRSRSTQPLVGIIMGSKNDKPKMQPAGQALEEAGIRYEVRVMSAHRDPELVREYCTQRADARPAR